MSSSSSLAGARRRRAGGGSGPTSTGTASTQGTPQSGAQQQQGQQPVNPFQLLQQHHFKITNLEKSVNDILTRGLTGLVNTTSEVNESGRQVQQGDINIEELSRVIMTNVESQLDLKAFYENDERLMNELEEVKQRLQSQQLVINGLNTTLYSIVDKLNITVNEDIIKDGPTFSKSVTVNEENNEVKEFTPIDESGETANFEPLS
jgi:hypothetical protein